MAGKSMLSRVPATGLFRSSGLSSAPHLSFPFFSSETRENAAPRRTLSRSGSVRASRTVEPALHGSFEAQAAVGRVECNSRGCRPIFDRPPPAATATDFPKQFTEFLDAVWMEKGAAESYFEGGVEANPLDSKLLCEYASFSWKLQHDADKAEDLYKQALKVAPDDADIIASYALFLWQSDL